MDKSAVSIDGLDEFSQISIEQAIVEVTETEVDAVVEEEVLTASGRAVAPEFVVAKRPSLIQNVSDPAAFGRCRTIFRGIYCDPSRPVIDVLGRKIEFDTEPTLDDAMHVCYGGLSGQPGNPDCWTAVRAARIPWIGLTLREPNFICTGNRGLDIHVYLRYFAPDMGTDQVAERFCVVARKMDKRRMAFITAYDISSKAYDAALKIDPRIYSRTPPKPHVPKRTRRKKNQGS